MAQADSVPSPIFNPITGASANRSTKQHRDRRYFIGGSDARIIMGDDEPSLIRLWREKRGEIESQDLSDNLIVQLGVATEPLNRLWFLLGMMLGKIMTPVVMSLLFFVVVTPVGFLMRAFGQDPLRLKRERNAESYWIKRSPPGPAAESLKNQF